MINLSDEDEVEGRGNNVGMSSVCPYTAELRKDGCLASWDTSAS